MSKTNSAPARTLDPTKQLLHLFGWDAEEAPEQEDAEQVEGFLIWVDEENNSEAWWAALDADEEFAEISKGLRAAGRALIVTPAELLALSELPGWEDGPDHAPHPLLWQSDWTTSED